MTRNIDRLEVLASDLVSRYGEDDAIVAEILTSITEQALAHSRWSSTKSDAPVKRHFSIKRHNRLGLPEVS